MTHTAAPPAATGATAAANSSGLAGGAGAAFTLSFEENPLAEFVELPDEALEGGLWFSNIYCGVIRGALEMASISYPPSCGPQVNCNSGPDAG